jgi:hypothetical protein
VKEGKSMSSIFPAESVPDLPNNTDIELAVTTRFGNRIGDFDQIKKTLSQFLWLGKRMIQRIGSTT